MCNIQNKNLFYAFGIYLKRFFISRYRRDEILINENKKSWNFSMSVNMGGAAWISYILKMLLSTREAKAFRRNFKGHIFSILRDVQVNARGAYMRLLKIA